MPYTNVAKPTGASYTNLSKPTGASYTSVSKPANSNTITSVGIFMGLGILTYPGVTVVSNPYTNLTKPT